jgi:hypothetical protein
MTRVQINARIEWKFQKTRSGMWIADCEPLGLTIQSASHTELREDIGDALDLFFRDLLKTRELDRFLQDRGWTRARVPLPTKPSEAFFDVPFELLQAGRDGSSTSLPH